MAYSQYYCGERLVLRPQFLVWTCPCFYTGTPCVLPAAFSELCSRCLICLHFHIFIPIIGRPKGHLPRRPPIHIIGRTKAWSKLCVWQHLNDCVTKPCNYAKSMLKTTTAVQNLKIKGRDDYGEGCHTTASEPYYHDSAYHPVKRPSAIPIRENRMCVMNLATQKVTVPRLKANNHPMSVRW